MADYAMAANYMLRDKILYGSAYPCVDVESSVAMYLENCVLKWWKTSCTRTPSASSA